MPAIPVFLERERERERERETLKTGSCLLPIHLILYSILPIALIATAKVVNYFGLSKKNRFWGDF